MSHINKVAAMRISKSPLGQALLDILVALEKETLSAGATNFFGQLGFLMPGDPIEEGDLIPTVHFSLQPFQPVLSEPITVVPEE